MSSCESRCSVSRSQYVWVVLDQGQPVAAFTVKRELAVWAGAQVNDPSKVVVRRFQDRGRAPQPWTEIRLEELL